MPQDYNKTVNLPQTDFAMRASLPAREPDMLKAWYDIDLYHKMIARNEGKPRFILHDGPPFSNGHIHMGTSMNKCLKDFIVRYKNMAGFQAPYVPGWDNHGMPIESAIIKQNKLDRKNMSIPEFRNACRDFAAKFVDIQRDQFKRLGVIGEWDKPYLTMDPSFEAEEVKVFGKMYEKGYIYRGKKPVYWCCSDETALAEAEIEYADDNCKSIYVKFKVTDDLGKLSKFAELDRTYFVIWTTTTWTIPGNLAISLNGNLDYVLAKAPNGETYILAKELLGAVGKATGIESFEILTELKGSEFEFMRAKHPLYDRESLVINGDHVTLDAGTGCVHTAPGHGMEDYMVCQKYDYSGKAKIGIIVPVDDRGIMTKDSGKYEGMFYAKANDAIWQDLSESGALLASQTISHPYPHCWRCKNPIIFRATDQWFCSVDAFKEEAAKACDNVTWLPEWGHDRIVSMIRERSDWCISRQRQWGLPIPVLYCEACAEPICTPETISKISKVFGEKGSTAWFEEDSSVFLPDGFICPKCGSKHFTKGTDTLDGWFDSGSTHFASLEHDNAADWPADLYLEGADQYRGWFQSSLLTAVATKGAAPYKAVLTHGWTVDGEGKAMHKSLGNSILPDDLIPKYGADLMRLWASSADYRVDMRCSDGIFKQLSDTYLKIRNTARFMLGNLDGFDPNSRVSFADMEQLDKWALTRTNKLIEKCISAYDNYEFYNVIHAVHKFCVMDMSNFYLDIVKDRLYCEKHDSQLRRSAQSALYEILDAMVRLIAPILAFTSNEIWLSMSHDKNANAEHVMLNDMPIVNPLYVFDSSTEESYSALIALRNDVNKALELARAEKIIGKPLEASVTLFVSESAKAQFEKISEMPLSTIFIVSETKLVFGEGEGYEGDESKGVTILIKPCGAPKCIRCWMHNEHIGENAEHPELCPRCAAAVSE
ncbi:MAG: isoleucine--tRNA ligase [Clostridia bacterium]|nr:isoleucine--tRNA ligase [Clostridia bacterium]